LSEIPESKALSGIEEKEAPLNHCTLLKRAFLMAKTGV
jgi:hypothetical protein